MRPPPPSSWADIGLDSSCVTGPDDTVPDLFLDRPYPFESCGPARSHSAGRGSLLTCGDIEENPGPVQGGGRGRNGKQRRLEPRAAQITTPGRRGRGEDLLSCGDVEANPGPNQTSPGLRRIQNALPYARPSDSLRVAMEVESTESPSQELPQILENLMLFGPPGEAMSVDACGGPTASAGSVGQTALVTWNPLFDALPPFPFPPLPAVPVATEPPSAQLPFMCPFGCGKGWMTLKSCSGHVELVHLPGLTDQSTLLPWLRFINRRVCQRCQFVVPASGRCRGCDTLALLGTRCSGPDPGGVADAQPPTPEE